MESNSVQNTIQDATQKVPVPVESVQCNTDPKQKSNKNQQKSQKLKKKIEVCEIKIEGISEEKASMKSIAKTIFLSATIIFLLSWWFNYF